MAASGFLAGVVAAKRAEVAALARDVGATELKRQAHAAAPPRDLAEALRAANGAVIAEIKRRSPTVPEFGHGRDAAGLARLYAEHGAAAISVVTDTERFGMSLDDVDVIRSASALPVLVKEFVIDRLQALAARAAGADALLLIARIVSVDDLAELRCAIEDELGMTALVECHDSADVAAAVAAGARVVGVNNRDLDTLQTALGTCERLLPEIPHGTIRVAESGISRPADVKRLRACGADAFLVGGALLASEDPGGLLTELVGGAA
jgi:indole-3-glycerol phosphate synthase